MTPTEIVQHEKSHDMRIIRVSQLSIDGSIDYSMKQHRVRRAPALTMVEPRRPLLCSITRDSPGKRGGRSYLTCGTIILHLKTDHGNNIINDELQAADTRAMAIGAQP